MVVAVFGVIIYIITVLGARVFPNVGQRDSPPLPDCHDRVSFSSPRHSRSLRSPTFDCYYHYYFFSSSFSIIIRILFCIMKNTPDHHCVILLLLSNTATAVIRYFHHDHSKNLYQLLLLLYTSRVSCTTLYEQRSRLFAKPWRVRIVLPIEMSVVFFFFFVSTVGI